MSKPESLDIRWNGIFPKPRQSEASKDVVPSHKETFLFEQWMNDASYEVRGMERFARPT